MTEKNIFAYKLFLSLNISDFNLFLGENCDPPPPLILKNVTPSFPATPSQQKGGAHYVDISILSDCNVEF